jgi:hypothetical protein
MSRRYAAKVDRNQSEIVGALRAVGASVQPLHSVGDGCPDLLVGWKGQNLLIEVKDHLASVSDQKLNPRQVRWHGDWRGQCAKATTIDEALRLLGVGTYGDLHRKIVGPITDAEIE